MGWETVALRYFNIFGPRQSFDIKEPVWRSNHAIPWKAAEEYAPNHIGDGEQTRDFVYVNDIVEANMLALNASEAIGEVINIGSGARTSVNRLAKVLKELTNKTDLENIYEDIRPGDVKHGYANISKAKELLDYNPKYSLKEGLSELVKCT